MDMSPGGILYFDGSSTLGSSMPGNPGDFAEQGYYTSCLFSVRDEGIVRLRIETSKGELYLYTPRLMAGDEDPQFVEAAKAWKPTDGPFMGEYDYVGVSVPANYSELIHTPLSEDEREERLYSAETIWNIDLMKRLGATAEMTVDEASGEQAADYLFGLWINEGSGMFGQLLDEYAKQTLTVTAWYEDGRESRVVIELSPVDVKARLIMGEDTEGNPWVIGSEMTEETVEPDSLSEEDLEELYREGYCIVHTLSGRVVGTQ
jgi:hypothetical protein